MNTANPSYSNQSNRLAVSYDEAAQLMGVCQKTVYNLVRAGKLPAKRIGRSVRIRLSDLENFLASH